MKSKFIILIVISILMTSSLAFAWSGDTWGPITRQTITSIASVMMDSKWKPKNNMHNFGYGSTWHDFTAGTEYTGEAYSQNNPQESWSEFYNAVTTTAGGTTYYGNDCSGFASMAWKLPSRYTTVTFESDATQSGGYVDKLGDVGSGASVSLLQGDALNKSSSHIILFNRYITGGVESMEQTPWTARRRSWTWTSLSTYRPIRRKEITSTPSCTDGYEPNNSTSEAKSISSGTTYNGKICTPTDIDYFKFSHLATGNINIYCTVPSGKDYDIELLNSSGTKVASGTNGPGTTENFNYNGAAGTYYVKIYGYNSSYDETNSYGLKATYIATVDNPPTCSITNPANGANVSGTVTVTASATDDKGISKVEFYIDSVLKGTDTASPFEYSWNTSGLSGSHTIYAKAYDTINQTKQSSTITVIIASAECDSYEPNDSFSAAKAISAGTITPKICSSTDNDYYKINVTSGQMIYISMTVPSDKDYDMKLYNPSQTQVAISQNPPGASESINYTASATGYYYIYVYGYNGSYSTTSTYSLTFSITSPTTPTVVWTSKPVTNVSTTVSWTNSHPSTHTHIHYGTNPDPRTNYTYYSTVKSGDAGTYSIQGLPGQPNWYYIVHSIMNGIDYWSIIIHCPSTTGGTCSAPTVDVSSMPTQFNLGQNYPNPFNPETTIGYQLPVADNVELKIYNATGQLVKTLVNEQQSAGYYTVKWNGKDDRGNMVPTGVYFYTLKTDKFTETKKMIIAK